MLFMKSSSAFERRAVAAVALVILSVCNVASFAKETWFNQRVTWKYGTEGLAQKTTLRKPNGQADYQFMLQPLWAAEGGVVALEIVVAHPKQPDVNLLGERTNGIEYPFVITKNLTRDWRTQNSEQYEPCTLMTSL